ncbi:adenylate/guanylate cyclase domain-containing protein [Ferrimonas senticii]|uniref:adenylate/guanylate cyclase domain-containing protein n=1 Tax=Ferrimonas senticii TaxID=394566 RepID=UPI0004250DAD|nr:adenylate/guanylate cyclase domain-containing protein [Ferrimonas senticii]
MQATQELKKFAFAVAAWSAAMLIFVSLRFTLTHETITDANTLGDVVTLVLYLGTILGCLHWLSNLIAVTSPLRRMNYLTIVVFKGVFLLVGALVLIKITTWINTWTPTPIEDRHYNDLTQSLLDSSATQVLLAYFVWVRLCLAFFEQMVLLVGTRNLVNMGLGNYHRPRQEERVFLFIDMAGSTAHAEALGDFQFSRLVQDCFDLLSSCVTRQHGEIYRYIGDAAMISWELNHDRNLEHSLDLYHEFVQLIGWHRDYFEEQYGFMPRFKGAIHGGRVMTAVVGVNKQEISYFSDVINTLARLQDQCGPLKKNLLISGQIRHRLGDNPNYQLEAIGPMRLKGKQHEIDVYAVTSLAATAESSAPEF